jgi:tRNA pseudouridine38-40 synthase
MSDSSRLRNIRLTLSYDGSDFGGWQSQKNARSVQEELETALSKMHGHPVRTLAAGRTDAGVHAMGQVANFYTDIRSIPAANFVPALNKLLPLDVRVLESREADYDFHARFDARLRRYRYFTLVGGASGAADPVRLRYAHLVFHRPDLAVLNAMASTMLGETDFTALCSARDESASRFRFVHEASFRWENGLLVFEIAANAFLLRMVRSIVGSLLSFEAAGREPGDFRALLESRDRKAAGPTAPARGLFLWNVEYYPAPRRPAAAAQFRAKSHEAGPAEADGLGDDDIADSADGGSPAGGARPAAPEDEIPAASPRGALRLVPGIGFVED